VTPQECLEPRSTYELVDLSVEGFADSEWDVEDEGGDMTAGAIAARLGLHSMTIVLLAEAGSSASTLSDVTDMDDFETLASSDSDTSRVFGQDDDDVDDDSLSSDESDE